MYVSMSTVSVKNCVTYIHIPMFISISSSSTSLTSYIRHLTVCLYVNLC